MFMRTKFRVWHLGQKRWAKEDDDYRIRIPDGVITRRFVSYDDGLDPWCDEWEGPLQSYELKNLVVQQWTGLLDRNGTEIYEGDILESSVALGRMGLIAKNTPVTVRFNQFLANYALDPEGWEHKDEHNFVDLTGAKAKKLIVVGNIFENE